MNFGSDIIAGQRHVHPQAFTNYGAIRFDTRHILQLHLDTWYYLQGQLLGRIDLGDGPLLVQTGVGEFVEEHLAGFCSAFASFLRPVYKIQATYKSALSNVHTLGAQFEVGERNRLARNLAATLGAEPVRVIGMNAYFDVRVDVRTAGGSIEEVWVPRAARFSMVAQWARDTERAGDESGVLPWYTSVNLPIRSLFHADNDDILKRVRRQWRELIIDDPAVDMFPDDVDAPLLVTLVNPPSGTPTTNQELYERNIPRLKDGISQWEHATSRQFEWNDVH